MPILDICGVSYDYCLKSGIVHALKDVSFSLESGKFYAIIGRSGSGKSTLLSMLAGFDQPKSGEILFNGDKLTKSGSIEYRRQNVGFIFQAYNLIPHLTALENVIIPLENAKISGAEKKKRANEALRSVGLDESLYNKFPPTMSGGEQQRVAVARAMVTRPAIILADEPTGNLDNENSEAVISLLKNYAHDSGKCVAVVTHSAEIASTADAVFRITDGRLAEGASKVR